MFESSELLAQAHRLGVRLQSRLADLSRFAKVGDVRGLGAMQALELVKDVKTKEPDPEAAAALVRFCYERGLILMSAGTYGNVIRLLMPLVIKEDELEEGLSVLEAGLAKVSA
jgi:4-aminobutyrate aminotransferase/(S)-3-amino-2-methylpropionate transaminase